jgi:outer membrane protein OmpA-like peptidoglycan-associated protein
LRIGIEGHTDSVGQPGYNQRLSAERAASVKAWLVGHGIDAARLDTAGFGDGRPVADNATEDGRARNRRVELVRR